MQFGVQMCNFTNLHTGTLNIETEMMINLYEMLLREIRHIPICVSTPSWTPSITIEETVELIYHWGEDVLMMRDMKEDLAIYWRRDS